jgi:hypothetical protein
MTTKYNIGTLNETTLATGNPNLGFTVVASDSTISDCIASAKRSSNKYIAFLNSVPITSLDSRGKCYKGNNYNPIVNPDDTTGTLYDIYGVPDIECTTTVKECLQGNANTILEKEEADIEKLIEANKKELNDVQIRLIAVNKNIPYANAEQEYKNNIEKAKLTAKLAELNSKKSLLEAHKLSLSARNSEASILLSDKNRLLATVNSNIQQKYTKLEDVNNKINTITQDIYTNNMETKRKENIIQTLNVIIIIVVIMAVILIIYFGMDYVEANHPEAFQNFTNKFNRSSLFI